MQYLSTQGQAPNVGLVDALLRGLAPDRGLYMPETVPTLDADFFDEARGLDMGETGVGLLRPYLRQPYLGSTFAEDRLEEAENLVREALNFPVPLKRIDDDVDVLEIFHGPTLAFKDVAARFLARFLAFFRTRNDVPLTILVATSGDTGGAVAQAFLGVPGTQVAVLYPKGKVSALQEKQFTTLGQNVRAFAVDGTFDDCQRLVKEAFADEGLRAKLDLTSANSINIGRLLPQMAYYVHGRAQLPEDAAPPLFSVPSGNFGNLTAGLLAHRMGLPVAGFVAATNANDVVPEYLETAVYRPRTSQRTISNAMDVGDPSNFVRIRHLYGNDTERLRGDVAGSRHTDDETRATIREVYERTGYVLDPHTAVGYRGLRQVQAQRQRDGAPPSRGIVLATAHPIKFREHVEPLIGREIDIPERLKACLDRKSEALDIPADLEALRGPLLAW